ncbi:MAG: hypothetical protein HY676_02575 [Chloroflexi bacterium]|nr:hypothetical protein [Chloroflexota bacterium]
MSEVKCTYFEQIGRANTEIALALARQRAMELGLDTVVVATTVGDTGARAVEVFRGMKVIVVSHSHGFKEPNTQEMTTQNRAKIEELGGTVLTSTHIFGSVGRAIRRKFNTYQTEEIIAQTLRMLGEGIKVVVEVSAMAADAGLVRTDKDILVVSGTGRGADTAVVMRAANTQDFFNMKIKEIICKPRLDPPPSQAEQRGEAAVPAQRPHHS